MAGKLEPFQQDRDSGRARRAHLTKRFSRILNAYEDLFWPDLFIIGGGASKPKRFAKFIDSIEARTPVVRAEFGNNAGIVGAAMWASEQ